MKPAWDKLMKKYENHENILIADVDCTAGGKELCGTVGVKGYPTLKYGDPDSLDSYEGGRTYDDLEKFASTLKPACSPKNRHLCDDAQKEAIEKIENMSDEDLAALIKKGEDDIKAAGKNFEDELAKLQETFKTLQKEKEATVTAIRAGGHGLRKSVRAAKFKAMAKDDAEPKDEL